MDAMSISEMNSFRQKIRESAEMGLPDINYLALDGVVKFIDLKNSAMTSGKQGILLDSLRKIGSALIEAAVSVCFTPPGFSALTRNTWRGIRYSRHQN